MGNKTLIAVMACSWALQGCGKSSNALTCGEPLTAYCATQSCASHVDPNDVIVSFCAGQTAINNFGVASCADGGGFEIMVSPSTDTEVFYHYDSSGQLVAVLQTIADAAPPDPYLRCVAGPSPFEVGKCMSGLVGYGCVRDGGVD